MIPSHWTETTLKIGDDFHHFYRTGDSRRPPLVLAHGFSDDGLCWLQTALDLEDQFDIIMPDARGHGRSERIRPGQPLDMTADLAAVIQALGLERPIVGGHSMGAMTAFLLGVRYPEIPRALILEDPPWFDPAQFQAAGPPDDHPMAAWVETINRSTLDELVAQTRIEHPTWPEWVIKTWGPAKKLLDTNILSVLNIRGTAWLENVSQLACPTLIITGDPDKGGLVTPALGSRVQKLNSFCTVEQIPGTGHHIRFEDYETYMGRLRAFLQGLPVS